MNSRSSATASHSSRVLCARTNCFRGNRLVDQIGEAHRVELRGRVAALLQCVVEDGLDDPAALAMTVEPATLRSSS